MQFTNDFWHVYDAAQKRLADDPEYIQIENEISNTLEQFQQQDLLEHLTNAMEMQYMLLANEIYKISQNTANSHVERNSGD
ncbi:MAG: hypothetical protein PHC86_08015 [Eubacteriales bacterium]|nr:hypothetical protein [Eubacteriales bacterium]